MARGAGRRPRRFHRVGALMAELDRRALADFFADYRAVSGGGSAP